MKEIASTNVLRSNNQPIEFKQRIGAIPISALIINMGIITLAIAWQQISVAYPHITSLKLAASVLGVFVTIFCVFFLITFYYRWLMFRAKVVAEFHNVFLVNFFPTIAITFTLLSIYWQHYTFFAKTLWVVGTTLQLILSSIIMARWVRHPELSLTTVNPAWFIPALGNILVPISGNAFGYHSLSTLFFTMGFFFWITLTSAILLRLFTRSGLPRFQIPTLSIFLAPPSIAFIAYTSFNHSLCTNTLILYSLAIFTLLVLMRYLCLFVSAPFSITSWAYGFSITTIALATIRFAQLAETQYWWWISLFFLAASTVIIFLLAIKTIQATASNLIFVPHPPTPTPYTHGVMAKQCKHNNL